MCTHEAHRYTCVPNMWLGEVCTDTMAMTMPMAPTMLTPTTHDGQSMIVQGFLIDKPYEPK